MRATAAETKQGAMEMEMAKSPVGEALLLSVLNTAPSNADFWS